MWSETVCLILFLLLGTSAFADEINCGEGLLIQYDSPSTGHKVKSCQVKRDGKYVKEGPTLNFDSSGKLVSSQNFTNDVETVANAEISAPVNAPVSQAPASSQQKTDCVTINEGLKMQRDNIAKNTDIGHKEFLESVYAGSLFNAGQKNCITLGPEDEKLIALYVGRAKNYISTPLIKAIMEGNNNVVEELLRGGTDPNLAGPEGETPLVSAAAVRNLPMIKLLLEKDADPNLSGRACPDGHEKFYIEGMSGKGGFGYTSDTKGCSNLFTPFMALNLIELFSERKSGPDSNINGWRPMLRDYNESAKAIINAKKFDPNIIVKLSGKMERSTLDFACEVQDVEIMTLLMQKGADVALTTWKGNTPFFVCFENYMSVSSERTEKILDMIWKSSNQSTKDRTLKLLETAHFGLRITKGKKKAILQKLGICNSVKKCIGEKD